MRSSYGGFGWGDNWGNRGGETATERKKRQKAERERWRSKDNSYKCSESGRDLIKSRELVMEAMRVELGRFVIDCARTSTIKVQIEYVDRNSDTHVIELHIPQKDYNTKPLMLWLEDQNVFLLNGKASAFSAVSADAKQIEAAIRRGALNLSYYFKEGKRPW